jgi:hypothetical protein
VRTVIVSQNVARQGVKMNKLDTLDPDFRSRIQSVRLDFLKETGYELAVVSTTRTIKEQHGLFVESHDGDSTTDHVTDADGGQSSHNFGLGCDNCPMRGREPWWDAPAELWQTYGRIAKEHGLVWGGDFKKFKDFPHVEGPRWRTQRTLWEAGKIQVA